MRNKKYQIFGGNSGYDGYSMSIRAREARREGRYPKGDFRSVYRVTEKSFKALIVLRIIDNDEWHHTGCYGRRTTFYSWIQEEYREIYERNKRLIDAFARQDKITEIEAIFINSM